MSVCTCVSSVLCAMLLCACSCGGVCVDVCECVGYMYMWVCE